MAIPINSAVPIVQILYNNSSISFPLSSGLTILLIILVIVYSLTIIFIKKLPEHIYKRFEKKLDRETELLKIISSQVEPQKVDTYLKIASSSVRLDAMAAADKQNLPPEKRELFIAENQEHFLLRTRFFLFASDDTIYKFIAIINNQPAKLNSHPSFMLYANLILSMRQDLHWDTKIDASHFCSVLGIKQF